MDLAVKNELLVHRLHKLVIQDVIANVQEDFADFADNDNVLEELSKTWEAKVREISAISPSAQVALKTDGDDLPQSIGKPSTGMEMMDIVINLAGSEEELTIQVPKSMDASELEPIIEGIFPDITQILNSCPIESVKDFIQQHIMAAFSVKTEQQEVAEVPIKIEMNADPEIIQLDGPYPSDDEDEENRMRIDEDLDESTDDDEDLDIKKIAEHGLNINSDNENDADSDDSDHINEGTDNVVLCQYKRVIRQRNRWRLELKDGVMNIGGKDYVFNKLSGELDW